MENLKDIDKKKLSEIIKSLNEKIFQSEAQFQFDLAWKLREKYNCDVRLEDMGVVRLDENDEKKIVQKYYTDIVVEQKDGYKVAIELKYKTAELEIKELEIKNDKSNIYLFNHGAVDLGRYDYLWDVHRLEQLLAGKSVDEKQIKVQKKCDRGFAVLLTNEKKYWEQKQYSKSEPIDLELRFEEKNESLCKNKKSKDGKGIQLDWLRDKKRFPCNKNNYPNAVFSNGKPTFRAQPINLNKAYSYKWEDYCDLPHDDLKNGRFRYVIIEVK